MRELVHTDLPEPVVPAISTWAVSYTHLDVYKRQHIASRVVTSNHHSIFGDHTDFMTCRTTGYAMLMSSSPQEAMDLAAVAHLSAIKAKYAFMHCFDGFRTSHEMQRIEALDYEELRPLLDQDAQMCIRDRNRDAPFLWAWAIWPQLMHLPLRNTAQFMALLPVCRPVVPQVSPFPLFIMP